MINCREDSKWTVYIHIVPKKLSGHDWDKYYIGITSYKNVTRRWYTDGSGYKAQTHFWNAIQKYGWDNMEHYIFAENLTKDEACKMEMILIEKLKSNNNSYGYNKTLGGEGSKGYKCSDEERKRRSARYLGENNPYYGKKHSEKIKKKMSEHHADVYGGNNPRARKIYQFDLDWNYVNDYPSSRDASRTLGCCDGMGSAAIHHKKFKNFYWCFEDNVFIDENGNIQVKNKYYPINHSVKKVYQFDENGKFIAVFPSVINASQVVGIPKKRISYAARNKYKSGGYIWRYKEDVKESEINSGSFILLN